MRRAYGSGTVVLIKGKYRARWSDEGRRIYGPARSTRDEAESDRLTGPPKPDSEPRRVLTSSAQTPFGDWAFECLAGGYGDQLMDATFDTNEGHRLNHLNGSPLADIPIGLVRPSHVQTWVSGLKRRVWDKESKAWVKSNEPMAPATVRRVYAMVSKCFALAVLDGIIDVSPCRSISLPHIPDRHNRVLTEREATELLNPRDQIDAALVLGIHGLSRKEVLLLEWHHVDWERGLLTVPGKKNVHRHRINPLSDWERRALSILDQTTERVIVNSAGRPYDPRKFSKVTMARMRSCGLPAETRFQDLRGTFITLALELGVNVKTVMDTVGHSSVATTMKAYARPKMGVAAAAMVTLESTIKKAVEKDVDK